MVEQKADTVDRMHPIHLAKIIINALGFINDHELMVPSAFHLPQVKRIIYLEGALVKKRIQENVFM